uniref:Ubiquitin-conjugating enzyme E2G 1a (UBC7 homolog, yeast) n=1 Tax=Oryzias melastigma TaxID=30732 RepID=A0A3B3DBB4_ORYME
MQHTSLTVIHLLTGIDPHGRSKLHFLNKNPVEGFSAGLIEDSDLYRWEVLIIGPPDTLYEGGVFKAHLTFPKDYPLRPPKMKFITDIWHPNVGKLRSWFSIILL